MRISREYRIGSAFLAVGLCAYTLIHVIHFRSRTEQRIEVASFSLIGFGTGQLSYAWALRRKKQKLPK